MTYTNVVPFPPAAAAKAKKPEPRERPSHPTTSDILDLIFG